METLILKKFSKTQKMEWFKNLDLAKQVTTKKNYVWKDFKTWKKEKVLKKIKKNLYM